ncbi:MAG: hypothetical protein ACI8QZ_003399 [Chlamydiales bacterium]|jgi:hypothetical protein
MLHHALNVLMLATAPAASLPDSTLLAAVPPDAFVLVHCHDLVALHERAARNDWVRMLGSSDGDALYASLADGFLDTTHTDFDQLLSIARTVQGEGVLFAGHSSAGFVTIPPPDRAALLAAMGRWLPGGEDAQRKSVMLSGARVELADWGAYSKPGDWDGRKGHFAALVDHPRLLGLFSADSADLVLKSVTASLAGLDSGVEPALAGAYREAGGGAGAGIELYVDFTPLTGAADEALRSMVRDVVPDPTRLLGLERGTWLHATANIFPGTRIEKHAHLHLPPDSVVMRLASTFRPLPHSLPAELPRGVQALWALRWNLPEFYSIARSALAAGGGEAGLQAVDQGLAAAEGMTGVDPVEDVLDQLEGTFAFYMLEGASDDDPLDNLGKMGFLAHLLDGEIFFEAFEQLVSGVGDVFERVELEGVDAYVFPSDPELDGGIAFLPKAFVVAPARPILVRALRALAGADGASLLDGSSMQAAIDENAGAAFLTVVDLASYRGIFLGKRRPESELPNPFESQLVGSARPIRDGFEFHLVTR